MKTLVLTTAIAIFFSVSLSTVDSKVYTTNELRSEEGKIVGESTHLDHLEFRLDDFSNGEKFRNMSTEYETLLIIKEGEFNIELGSESKTLGPGSIALVLPDDEYVMTSTEDGGEAYIMEYASKAPADKERGEEAGGSFIVDFDELEFNEHDRGGIRNYYNRPTAMMEYFEMHVTNLNGLIKSHEPHTHGAAEIVLMIKGDTEMQIGEDFYQGKAGDVYFLESEIPHAIENKGEEQCMYFAFQWE
jgi:(S)-ureidoglycine aminohydrolase